TLGRRELRAERCAEREAEPAADADADQAPRLVERELMRPRAELRDDDPAGRERLAHAFAEPVVADRRGRARVRERTRALRVELGPLLGQLGPARGDLAGVRAHGRERVDEEA